MLAQFGVPSPPEVLCQDADAAVAAGARRRLPGRAEGELAGRSPTRASLAWCAWTCATDDEVRLVFEELVVAATQAAPGALDGILVQPFVRGGVEAIVGLSDDPMLGRLVMLGLGGTLVEALGAGDLAGLPDRPGRGRRDDRRRPGPGDAAARRARRAAGRPGRPGAGARRRLGAGRAAGRPAGDGRRQPAAGARRRARACWPSTR